MTRSSKLVTIGYYGMPRARNAGRRSRSSVSALALTACLITLGGCGSDDPGQASNPHPPGTGGSTTGSGGGGAGGSGALPGTGGAAAGGGAFGSGGSGNSAGADAGSQDSGGGGSAGGGQGTARPFANPPTYMGNGGGSSGCNKSYATAGFEPVDANGSKHPLFLYYVGTSLSASDQSSRYDSPATKAVTEAMARRGFVAFSVQYDNSLSLNPDKLTCLYGSGNPKSVLAVACALPQVNCDLAIATWGHSQGALMAHAASSFDTRVRAVWTTGYSGGSYPLSVNRLRVVNGSADGMNNGWDVVNRAAGFKSGECPNDGRTECLRPDGSGFMLVQKKDCVSNSADHCWFDKRSCIDNAVTLEPNWTDRASTKPFALESNADWVARTALRP